MAKELGVANLVADYSTLIWAGSIVLFGSVAHTAAQIKKAREAKKTFTWVDFFIAFFIALFSGLMFGIVASYLVDDPKVIYCSCGAGAFLGLQGVNSLANSVLDVLSRRVSRDE